MDLIGFLCVDWCIDGLWGVCLLGIFINGNYFIGLVYFFGGVIWFYCYNDLLIDEIDCGYFDVGKIFVVG